MNSAGSPPVIFTVLEEDASTDGARARGTQRAGVESFRSLEI